MKSSVEVLSPTRVRLDVEVAYSELESHVANAYKKVASQVNIPGFRKGKIPASMIDQRVGRGTVIDEAINSALPEFYGQAAREHKVAVIGRPEVDVKEFVDNEKLVFAVTSMFNTREYFWSTQFHLSDSPTDTIRMVTSPKPFQLS